jgi:hypothetical protein
MKRRKGGTTNGFEQRETDGQVESGTEPKAAARGQGAQAHQIAGTPCRCRDCMKARKKPREWPRHYMGIPVRQDRNGPRPTRWQSFECHIEGQSCDPELLEELTALRNEPERVGSVTVERRRRL